MIDRGTIYRTGGAGMRNVEIIASVVLLVTTLLFIGCGGAIDEPRSPKGKAVAPTIRTTVPSSDPSTNAVHAVDTGTAAQAAVPSDTGTAPVTGVAAPSKDASVAARATSGGAKLSAPFSIRLKARALARTIELSSDTLSVANGFLCSVPTKGNRNGGEARVMNVSRFAQFGRTDSVFRFQWVVSMDHDRGKLTGRSAMVGGRKGYEVTLSGPMHLSIILKGATQPIRLHSRGEVILKGFSRSWPPRGVTLALAEDSVGFYYDKTLNDTAAKPMVLVLDAQAVIGNGSSSYFDRAPSITKASVIDGAGSPWRQGSVGGVRLEWNNTASLLGAAKIVGYHIYRSSSPDDPSSWRRIASVPATQTSIEDKSYDGTAPVSYMVTHHAEYPTGYEYEGSFQQPTIVKGVLR